MVSRWLGGRMGGVPGVGMPGAGAPGSAAAADAAQRQAASDAYAQQQYEELQKKADEKSKAEAEACPSCPKKNREKCAQLRKAIENQVDDINKRHDEVVQNKCELPFQHKDSSYEKSVMGHYLHYWLLQEQLRNNMAEYRAKLCGEMPKGAEEAASKGTPKPRVEPQAYSEGLNKCGY